MKTAVLGFGYWAPNIVRSLIGLTAVEDVLIIEPATHRRSAAESQFAGVRTSATLQTALDDQRIEAVFICTPARTHFEVGMQVLRAGKSAFIEKPFASSTSEALGLFATAREHSRVVYPGHIFLHTSYFLTLQALLRRGELGELRYGMANRASLGPRAREDISATWDYLIHDVYILNALLDGPPLTVTARGAPYLRASTADVTFAVLEYPKQLLINLYSSWYAPEKMRSLLLVGSEAMVDYDEFRPERWRLFARGYQTKEGTDSHGNVGLKLYDHGVRSIPEPVGEEPLKREISAFLKQVERKQQPPWVENHVLQVTQTLEAIDESMAAHGQPIRLNRQENSSTRHSSNT